MLELFPLYQNLTAVCLTKCHDWNGMFKDGSLSKQTKAVLDKYLKQHGLHIASNKQGMLMEVQRHIIETTSTRLYGRGGNPTMQ